MAVIARIGMAAFIHGDVAVRRHVSLFLKPRIDHRLCEEFSAVKYLILPLTVVLSFFGVYTKLWGASPWDVFSMLPVLPLFSLHRRREDCIKGCAGCTRKCPSDIGLPEDGSGGTAGFLANAFMLSMVAGICSPTAMVFVAERNDRAVVGPSQAMESRNRQNLQSHRQRLWRAGSMS